MVRPVVAQVAPVAMVRPAAVRVDQVVLAVMVRPVAAVPVVMVRPVAAVPVVMVRPAGARVARAVTVRRVVPVATAHPDIHPRARLLADMAHQDRLTVRRTRRPAVALDRAVPRRPS